MMTDQRTPYDAEHVHIVDDGTIVTAVWIEDPAKAKDPRAVLEGTTTPESVWEYAIVAEAKRFYKRDGAGFSGWVVSSGNDYGDAIPNKRAALRELKYCIRSHFDR